LRSDLSVVIIANNASLRIGEVIGAARRVSNDIVVCDSGSDDNTVDIANDLGARVIHQDWKGYSATKNIANSYAANDWVLSLDSDEVMSEALIDSIEGLTFEDHKVYLLNRSNYFCGKQIRFSNWSPDHIPRLFNKKVASWTGDFVHEKLSFGDNVKKELLNGRLDHYSYESYSQRMDKVFNYAKLSAHERFQKGKRTNLIWTILTSISKFIITYFIHLGFLDGKAGFQIALTDALGSWKRNRIMMELQNDRVPECCK